MTPAQARQLVAAYKRAVAVRQMAERTLDKARADVDAALVAIYREAESVRVVAHLTKLPTMTVHDALRRNQTRSTKG